MEEKTKNKRGKSKGMGTVGRPSKKMNERGSNSTSDNDAASISHSFLSGDMYQHTYQTRRSKQDCLDLRLKEKMKEGYSGRSNSESKEPAYASPLDTNRALSIQNVDENPSEISTLLLVKQILLEESNKLNPVSTISNEEITTKSPVQAQPILMNANELSPSSKIPLNDFLPELPVQTQGPEETGDRTEQIWDQLPSIPHLSLGKTLVLTGDKSCKNDEIASQSNNSLVDVINGYKVKKDLVPLLETIFTKYGDITKYSSFSKPSRSSLLEMVCGIYHQLEFSNLDDLTALELQSMLDQVRDLEFVKVEVGWLRNRLNQISRIRDLSGASTVKHFEERNSMLIEEKIKAVENYEMQLATSLATTKDLQKRLKQEKDELAAVVADVDQIKYFYEGSLVRGLI